MLRSKPEFMILVVFRQKVTTRGSYSPIMVAKREELPAALS